MCACLSLDCMHERSRNLMGRNSGNIIEVYSRLVLGDFTIIILGEMGKFLGQLPF